MQRHPIGVPEWGFAHFISTHSCVLDVNTRSPRVPTMLITELTYWNHAMLVQAGALDLWGQVKALHVVEQSNGYDPIIVANVGEEVWLMQRGADPLALSDMRAYVLAGEILRLKGSRKDSLHRSLDLVFHLKGLDEGNAGDWYLRMGPQPFKDTLKGSHNLQELAEALLYGLADVDDEED